jgi:hypothetical protein
MEATPAWSWAFDAGPVLEITVQPYRASPAPGWFDVTFAVAVHPFHGTVRSTWFSEDLAQLADAFTQLESTDAALAVGGHRAAELRLSGAPVVGSDEQLAVEAWLTENGDDPLPALSFGFYATRAELHEAAKSLTEFVARVER